LTELERISLSSNDHHEINAGVEALAHNTEAFAAHRMNRSIHDALTGRPWKTFRTDYLHARHHHPSPSRVLPSGRLSIQAKTGDSICEALLAHDIEIEHACEMSAACTTCHVVVRQGLASLNEMDEVEEDLLDRAWGLEPNSRLSCQTILAQQDVTIDIPKYSINHAKEAHPKP
jgi:2Fe-2S type ferredoxin (ISC system)